MARFLVSGKAELVADVAAALRAESAEAVEVGDLDALTRACADAGPRAFDGYVQLPARFTVEGDSAVERVRHYISGGVLARFTAVAAVLPIAGGSCSWPECSSDQRAQSSHQEPLRRSALLRQAAAVEGACSPSATWYQAFGPGGLTMPAMCPPLLSTNRTGPLTSPIVLNDASHGTMWSLMALTT